MSCVNLANPGCGNHCQTAQLSTQATLGHFAPLTHIAIEVPERGLVSAMTLMATAHIKLVTEVLPGGYGGPGTIYLPGEKAAAPTISAMQV